MKITRIDTALYRLPAHRKIVDAIQEFSTLEAVSAEIHTEDGTTGFGFGYTIGRGGRAVKVLLDTEIVPLLLGEESDDIERLFEKIWWQLHWIGRQGLLPVAYAAADIALWDLKGIRAEQPLYKLLGAARERIPIYDTDGGWLNHSQDELIRNSAENLAQGFAGIKMKVGKPDRAEDVARIRAVRQAIGDDTKLMVDANLHWTAAEALARAHLFEEFDLYWLEEPIEADDVGGHAHLSRGTAIPIAIGESLYNRYAFKEFLAQDAAGILQPDVGRVGGITEWLRIANMANGFNVVVAPHFLMEFHTQMVCAVPNAIFAEHIPFLNRFVTEPLRVEDGFAYPSQQPGHGVRFDPAKVEPHLIETSSWTP